MGGWWCWCWWFGYDDAEMSQMSVLETSQRISYVHPKFPRILQSRLNCTPSWLRTSYLRDTCEGCRSETWGSGLQTVRNDEKRIFWPWDGKWLVMLVCVTHYWITKWSLQLWQCTEVRPFWFADSWLLRQGLIIFRCIWATCAARDLLQATQKKHI